MEEGDLISPIAAARSEYLEFKKNPSIQDELRGKMTAAKEKTRQLIKTCQTKGLKVKNHPIEYSDSIHDLRETDEEGKLIETNLTVYVDNLEDAKKAVNFCKENNLMALPIGAKTSGLGVFEAYTIARQKGFDGVLGIELKSYDYKDHTPDSDKEIDLSKLAIKIPEYNSSDYQLIPHSEGLPLALLKSRSFPQDPTKPHRVIAHPGLRISHLNRFLNDAMSTDQYHFRLMPDPSSINDAHVGGIIATGAEGGNRVKASDDLHSCLMINGNGEELCLNNGEMSKVVGANGAAGIIIQAEFEVSAFPKHQHGLLIPIKGHRAEALQNMLKIQEKLKTYCKTSNGNKRLFFGDNQSGLIVTGMEPLSKSAFDISFENSGAVTQIDDPIKNLMQSHEYALYVTFNSTNSFSELDCEAFLTEILGIELSGDQCDEEGNFECKEKDEYDVIKLFSPQELPRMDAIRHSAPTHSKEVGKKLGGVTQSTDLNIRFTDSDKKINELAQKEVAKIYDDYMASFKPEDGFRVILYGHMHPGFGEGGGIDPHVRIIFELSNPGSRYNAPENVLLMKKRQTDLYRKLLALDGKYGIEIHCPEKSRFTNTEYWNWYCLFHQEQAREYLQAIVDNGYCKDESGSPSLPIFGARMPHELPGVVPRVSGGVFALLNKTLVLDETPNPNCLIPAVVQRHFAAILELSQLSHRGHEIKRMLGDTIMTIHQKFHLKKDQYPFFVESPLEVQNIVNNNFGETASKYKVQNVVVDNLSETDESKFPNDPNTFYAVSVKGVSQYMGTYIMIAPHEAIKEAYTKTIDGENKTAFRNLYKMWEKWPYETDETPNLPGIAAIGLTLQEEDFPDPQYCPNEDRIITANPGPAQIHRALFEGIAEFFKNFDELVSTRKQLEMIERLKKFLGIPENHALAFCTSATQMMQLIAEALSEKADEVDTAMVANDAFSERFIEIILSQCKGIKAIRTPWTSSEYSQKAEVVECLVKVIDSERDKLTLIFVTPHKTSTTADFMPQILIEALKEKGKIMGRDYLLICDITSAAGGRNYATETNRDSGVTEHPFSGILGSLQKAMGQPPGLAFGAFAPKLCKLLTSNEGRAAHNLGKALVEAQSGQIINPLGAYLLNKMLQAQEIAQKTPEKIAEETQKKIHLVLGWLDMHPDLMLQVQDGLDQSPILVGIFSQAKNLVIAKRLLAEIFGYYVGEGYGPFSKEAIRLYLPNIAYDELKKLLAALDMILELDDVVGTRGEHIPNISLREPHNPLSVIKRLSEQLTVDDLFIETAGLGWLDRLVKTYNGNIPESKDKILALGIVPSSTRGFQTKAKIYGMNGNLEEIKKILSIKDDQGYSILDYYQSYLATQENIRGCILNNPNAFYRNGDQLSESTKFMLNQAKSYLKQVAILLERYVRELSPKDLREGKVPWPLAA